jgi:hypothetical protein
MAVGRGDSGCKFDVESSESSPNRARSSRTHDREIVAARHRSDNRARNLAAATRVRPRERAIDGQRSGAVLQVCAQALSPAHDASLPCLHELRRFRASSPAYR